MSNILITPILIDGTHYCLQDDGLTVPILGGMASTTPKVVVTAGGPRFSGDNVFNIYQSNPGPGDNERYEDDVVRTGSIKFGVHQCAESINIRVYGRADTYDTGFDTLDITIDGVSIKNFESDASTPIPPAAAPFSNTKTFNETVIHTFATDIPCGHIVDISGASGTVYNNNVGYDVKITVNLPT